MYAIYDKTSNRVVCKYYGEESSIAGFYNLDKFGYVPTNESALSGNPREYIVENGVVKRRNVEEIIAEIEGLNPLLKELNALRQENLVLGQQTVDLDLRLLIGGM